MSPRVILPYFALGCLLTTLVLAQTGDNTPAKDTPATDAAASETTPAPETKADEAQAAETPATPEAKPKPVLRHIILLKFKAEATPAHIAEVEQAFASLEDKIDVVQDLEWGTNNSPEGLAKGYTHCFLVTFRTPADRDIYLPHPAHKEFVEILKPHLEEAMVVDYIPQD